VLYEQYFIDDLKDRADLVRIIEQFRLQSFEEQGAF